MVLSLAGATIISVNNQEPSLDQYISVTVDEGESIWELSQQYENQHHLSPQKFVRWVEDNNEMKDTTIYAGDTLVIPVKKESRYAQDFASQ
jgi:hypothetical protein